MPGIVRSRSTMSGCSVAALEIAAAPSSASPDDVETLLCEQR